MRQDSRHHFLQLSPGAILLDHGVSTISQSHPAQSNIPGSLIPKANGPHPRCILKKKNATGDDELLSNSNCTQCLSLAAWRQLLPPGPDPLEEKTCPRPATMSCQIATVWRGCVSSNSKCTEGGVGVGRGEGPFALCINIPNMISDTLLNLQIIKIFRAPRGS